ncbi:MAG: hypothetical protein Q9196_002019 [Gyalolechia fulgens]
MASQSEEYPQAITMENSHDPPPAAKDANSAGMIPGGLVATKDENVLCPIKYIYDYLPHQQKWLIPQPISPNHLFKQAGNGYQRSTAYYAESPNSIILHPQAAGLPIHTGLVDFRQSKYWATIDITIRELLRIFAEDERCGEIMLQDHRSLADLARDQLKAPVMDSYARFSVYMCADADEESARLLAQSFVLIFLFDDMWESSSQETIEDFRHDFVALLQGKNPLSSLKTPLERRVNAMRQGFLSGDQEGGNGGAEVLETLSNFCHHSQPPRQGFCSVRDYLDYRYGDIACSFAWACAKFAIHSSISQSHPSLLPLIRLIGDHISIANDIASYSKEKARFDSGKSRSMINIVDVIISLESLEANAAKSIAYAWQLLTENQILDQLEDLKMNSRLDMEEWNFVNACLLAASGNLLSSVVMSRYGGEDARVA